jgi:hypothetical protein
MPLRLNIGLTKKVGQPDYGSVGASCHLEIELDQTLIVSDPDGFQERVRRTFTVCRQAVEDELSRHHSAGAGNGSAEPSQATRAATGSNGNGARRNGNGHRASQKQLGYVHQLAGQLQGMDVRRLEALTNKMYGKPLADLSSLDASGLIDMLKSIKSGAVTLGDALNGAPGDTGAAA